MSKASWRDLIPGPLMAVLVGMGFHGYWRCYENHVCMVGHLIHPDLQNVFKGYMMDVWWVFLWLVAPFVSIFGKSIAIGQCGARTWNRRRTVHACRRQAESAVCAGSGQSPVAVVPRRCFFQGPELSRLCLRVY